MPVVNLAKRYKFMLVNDVAYARIAFDSYTAPSFLDVARRHGCRGGVRLFF